MSRATMSVNPPTDAAHEHSENSADAKEFKPPHDTLVVSYKAKLRPIENIAQELPLLFYAFDFRLILLGLNAKELYQAATYWINHSDNREKMLKDLKVLKKTTVTYKDLEALSTEIFIGLRKMIVDIKDEDIKQILNGPIKEFCAQHKYHGCIARLLDYQEQAKEELTKCSVNSKETLERSEAAWQERINYVLTQRSRREWIHDQIFKAPIILIGFYVVCMIYLRFFNDTQNEQTQKGLQFYSKAFREDFSLIPAFLIMGKIAEWLGLKKNYMPHAPADAELIKGTLNNSFLRFIKQKAKENAQSPYLPFLELLPSPPPARSFSIVEEDDATAGPRKLKRYQQPSTESAAGAGQQGSGAAAAATAKSKDIVDAKGNNTYFFLSADNAKRYARFNSDDLKTLHPNKDVGSQIVTVNHVKTALETDRVIPPPSKSEQKKGPFKNMQGKLRLDGQDFRLAFKARPATASEQLMGIDGEVMSPNSFVKHQEYR